MDEKARLDLREKAQKAIAEIQQDAAERGLRLTEEEVEVEIRAAREERKRASADRDSPR